MHSGLALSAAAGLLPLAAPQPALANNKVLSADWEKVDLPVDKGVVLLDIGFTGTDPNHGEQGSEQLGEAAAAAAAAAMSSTLWWLPFRRCYGPRYAVCRIQERVAD
jgi:hypothetical protein